MKEIVTHKLHEASRAKKNCLFEWRYQGDHRIENRMPARPKSQDSHHSRSPKQDIKMANTAEKIHHGMTDGKACPH